MTNYNDGKWHGWNGGECPVHPKSQVQYVTQDGGAQERCAGKLTWQEPNCHPIRAFRVIKEHKEPREFWIDPENGDVCEHRVRQYVHVREVLE